MPNRSTLAVRASLAHSVSEFQSAMSALLQIVRRPQNAKPNLTDSDELARLRAQTERVRLSTPAGRAYTNARRAGRTNPDKRETRRTPNVNRKPNRADKRASGGTSNAWRTSPRKARGFHPLAAPVLVLRAQARSLRESDPERADSIDRLASSITTPQPV